MRDAEAVSHADIDRLVTYSARPIPVSNMGGTTAVVVTIWAGIVRVVGWSDVKRYGEPSRGDQGDNVFYHLFTSARRGTKTRGRLDYGGVETLTPST